MSNERKPLGRVQLQPRAIPVEPTPRRPDAPAPRQEVARQDPPTRRAEPPITRAEPPRTFSMTDLPAMQGFDLGSLRLDLSVLKSVPRVVALAHKLLPVRETATELEVVMARPDNRKAIDELEFVTGKTVKAYAAQEADLVVHLRSAYDAFERGEAQYAPAPRPAPRPEPKPEPPPEPKPAPRPEPQPAPRSEPKPAPRAEPKPIERRAEPAAEAPKPIRRATPAPAPAPARGRSRTPPPRRPSSTSTRAEKPTVRPPPSPSSRRTPVVRRAVRDLRSDDD